MKASTVSQLNQLTQAFYKQAAGEFDRTRQTEWAGWSKLSPYLDNITETSNTNPTCIDLGCGNARWAKFLGTQFPQITWQYQGYDSSLGLLEKAQAELKNQPNITSELHHFDLVQTLLNQQQPPNFIPAMTDLIVGFGFIHHIPSQVLRRQLFELLSHWLKPNGYLVIAAWQFSNEPRLVAKQVDPASLSIDPAELEPNDYILTWEGAQTCYRYCHQVSVEEMSDLTHNLPLKLQTEFIEDGHNHNLNQYWVWQKSATI